MSSTDKIELPLTIRPDYDIEKIIKDYRDKFEAAINQTFSKTFGEKAKLTTQGTFEQAGKTYSVRAKASRRALDDPNAPDAGELDYSVVIKEVSSELAKQIKDLRKRIKHQPLEMQEAELEKFITSVGDIDNELMNRLSKLRKDRLKKVKARVKNLPLGKQEEKLEEFIRDFGDIDNEMTSELAKVRSTKFKQALASLRTKISTKAPLTQLADVRKAMKAGEILAEDGDNLLRALKKKFGNIGLTAKQRKFKLERERIAPFSIDTQINALEQLLQTATYLTPDMRLQAQSRIDMLKLRKARRQFRQTRTNTIGKATEDQIKDWEAYKQTANALQEEADAELRILQARKARTTASRSKQKLRRQKLSSLDKFYAKQDELSGLDLHTQIQGWREYIKAGGDFFTRAEGKIRRLQERMRKGVQTAKRTKFTEFTKSVAAMDDPIQQLDAVEKYLAQRRVRFRDEATALRNRIKRGIDNAKAAKMRESNKNFANNMLMASGAGLGLLGAAGFPLLNVGFAAMSGGPVGAALVGTTTAIGELSRALINLKENAVSVAKEIGFVPKGFKLAEASMKGFEAFAGLGALSVQQASLEAQLRDYKRYGNAALKAAMMVESSQTGFWRTRDDILLGRSITSSLALGPMGVPYKYGRNVAENYIFGNRKILENTESARNSLIREMGRSTVGVENDPYTTWLRIQNSVLDPTKQAEREYQRKMLEALDEQIAALKDNTEAQKGKVSSWTGGLF